MNLPETVQAHALDTAEPGSMPGIAGALGRHPRLVVTGQYLGFFGGLLALYGLGATFPFQVGGAFVAAMTLHVWIQTFPTRLSRAGQQTQAIQLAKTFANHSEGELSALHRLDQAEFCLRAEATEAAKSALAQVDAEALPEEQRLRFFQISSSLWMQLGDVDGALVMSEAAQAEADRPHLEHRPEIKLHRALALLGAGRKREAWGCLEGLEEQKLTAPQQEFLQVVRELAKIDLAIPEAPLDR